MQKGFEPEYLTILRNLQTMRDPFLGGEGKQLVARKHRVVNRLHVGRDQCDLWRRFSDHVYL